MTSTVTKPATTKAPSTTTATASGSGKQAAHHGDGRVQDEREEHGDRRRDQHLLAEIERRDRGRAHNGHGGNVAEEPVAGLLLAEIEYLHCWPR